MLIHTKLNNFLKQPFYKILSQKAFKKENNRKKFIKNIKDYFIPYGIDV